MGSVFPPWPQPRTRLDQEITKSHVWARHPFDPNKKGSPRATQVGRFCRLCRLALIDNSAEPGSSAQIDPGIRMLAQAVWPDWLPQLRCSSSRVGAVAEVRSCSSQYSLVTFQLLTPRPLGFSGGRLPTL